MECSICQEKLTNYLVQTNCECNYSYHQHCLSKWLKISRSCPTCRKVFNVNPFEIDTKQLDLIKNAMFYDSIGRYHQFHMNNFSN
jgi:hypothetical protein